MKKIITITIVGLFISNCGLLNFSGKMKKRHIKTLKKQVYHVLKTVDSLESSSNDYPLIKSQLMDSITYWADTLEIKEFHGLKYNHFVKYQDEKRSFTYLNDKIDRKEFHNNIFYPEISYLSRIVLFNETKDKAILNYVNIESEGISVSSFIAIKEKDNNWIFVKSVLETFYDDSKRKINSESLDTLIVSNFITQNKYMDYKVDNLEISKDFFNGHSPVRFFDKEELERSIKDHNDLVNKAKQILLEGKKKDPAD